jgi:hypothetical protein
MTTNEMDRVLERFHGALVEEIRAKRPDYLDGPFTVAEIYQTFVPYGTHRDRIGVEMNGDYEDALLRLLSGEGDYLVLDSEPALRRIRDEIESPNPNTGLFREFAAVDVRLNPARVSTFAEPVGAPLWDAADDGSSISIGDLAPSEELGASATGAAAGDEPVLAQTCPWCRAELPERPNLNFCPFCGTDVHVIPCPECGAELEPEWRFCITCGAEVRG